MAAVAEQRSQTASYVKLVVVAGAIGVPAAAAAALLLGFVHLMEHWLWTDLPDRLGDTSPPWFLVIGLTLAGVLVVLVVRLLLPGDGGAPPGASRWGVIAELADLLGADSQDVLFSGQASIPSLVAQTSTGIVLLLLAAAGA